MLKKILNRAAPYINYAYQQTQKRGMPAEFALLPVIESAYNPHAYSRVGAAGLWQLMPGTASSEGLTIDWWYDARLDVVASTNTALNFLVRLHSNLGNWKLAAAAYDAGQGAVRAAIARNKHVHKSTNFESLSLPLETRNYIPKLFAVAAIIKDPSKYGITLPNVPNRPYFSVVTMKSQIDRGEIARLAGISVDTVRQLNPGMQRWATRPGSDYHLLIPTANVNQFLNNLKRVAGRPHVSWQYHEVHSGQTLAGIAHDYHTTVSLLQKVNGLKDTKVHPEQGILVPLHLNKTFAMPVGVKKMPARNQGIQKLNFNQNLNSVKNLTAMEVLSGKTAPVHDNHPTHPQTAPVVQAKPSTKKTSQHFINKSDSLKSLLNKIYKSK